MLLDMSQEAYVSDHRLPFGRGNRVGPSLALLLLGALGVAALCAAPTWAITIQDGSDPASHLVQPGSPYDMVGFFSLVDGASGVMVGPREVLTAKHVVAGVTDPTSVSFRLDLPSGTVYCPVSQIYQNPDADIALVILASNTGLSGYGMYSGTSEYGKNITLAGYGSTGTGSTGSLYGDPRGTKRFATNVVNGAGPSGNGQVISYTFDANGPSTEGMITYGDSGGPSFITDNSGNLRLAGIHSAISQGSGHTGSPALGQYGDTAYDMRISSYRMWAASLVPGDANGDGKIDIKDYNLWAGNYGKSGSGLAGDFNGDDVVDGADYTILADDWGFNTGAVSATGGDMSGYEVSPIPDMSVPEPATMALLMAGAALALRRPRAAK
jgi:hypothetical protein